MILSIVRNKVKLTIFKGCDEVCFVVPTADVTGSNFSEFYRSATNQSSSIPTIVAVESRGNDFNFSKSVNAGITHIFRKYSVNKYICISNDDVLIPHNFIYDMIKCVKSESKIGYITPIFERNDQKVHNRVEMPNYTAVLFFTLFYRFLYLMKSFAFPLIIKSRRLVQKIVNGTTVGSTTERNLGMINSQPVCFIEKNKLEMIGLFDENFNNGCEDFDFAIRTYLLGLRVFVNTNVVAHDVGSGTIGKGGFNALYISIGNDNGIRSSKNWSYLIQKYGRTQYKKFLELSNNNSYYFC